MADIPEDRSRIEHIIKVRNYGPRMEHHAVVLRHLELRPADRVLDIGCGLGEMLEAIQGSIRQGVGLDIDPELLADCRSVLPATPFVRGDATRLPFADASFDVVISCGVIEHVNDPTRFLQEVYRVCRRSAVIMTPNIGRPNRLIAAARGRIHRERSGHKQGWDYHLLKQVIEHNGWEVQRLETRFVDFPPYRFFPKRFGRWMSHVVLKKWFPNAGSELYAFCNVPAARAAATPPGSPPPTP